MSRFLNWVKKYICCMDDNEDNVPDYEEDSESYPTGNEECR